MYALAVQRDFSAKHHLTGTQHESEKETHTHHFVLELRVEGAELDHYGYIVELFEIEEELNRVISQYKDRTLNDLEIFAGINPSLENFARILWKQLVLVNSQHAIESLTVKLWQDEFTWASYCGD